MRILVKIVQISKFNDLKLSDDNIFLCMLEKKETSGYQVGRDRGEPRSKGGRKSMEGERAGIKGKK